MKKEMKDGPLRAGDPRRRFTFQVWSKKRKGHWTSRLCLYEFNTDFDQDNIDDIDAGKVPKQLAAATAERKKGAGVTPCPF
jgi:hypothetical protein